jgi:predicted permease
MRARIFRALLPFFPREFQRRFRDELLATAERLDRSRPAAFWHVPLIVIDAVATLRGVRRDVALESRPIDRRQRRMLMNGLLQDVRFAARGLRRDAWFTAFVVIALALGIGANAAMFGIVDRLLLSGPPHIRDANRVVRVYLTGQAAGHKPFTTSQLGHVSYETARLGARSFAALAEYAVNDVVIGEGADAHVAAGGYASDTLFPLLGVQPAVGRFFREDENLPGSAAQVAVLGFGMWQRAFGGADPVGQYLTIGGARYDIVGVAPRGFTGPQQGPVDVWMPMNLKGPRTSANWQTTWTAQWLTIVGRLAPGVTPAQASDELTTLHRRSYTGTKPHIAGAREFVAPISANDDGVDPPEVAIVRWLAGVALIVLVIACANVANLLLARGMRRSRELALRSALGARPARLVRLLISESLLLSITAAALGIGIAYAVGGLARRLIFTWVDWSASPVDARVLLASAVLAIVTGLVIGLLPAWRAIGANLTGNLKQGSREGQGQRSRTRHALTIAQAALSVVLMIGAGLFVRSLWHVRNVHLGFDADRVLVAEISWPSVASFPGPDAQNAERARRRALTTDAIAAVRALRGIEGASAAVGTPFGNRFSVKVRLPGLDVVPTLESGGPSVSAVAADYFTTVGTPIVRGRSFGPADRAGSEPVAIVSEMMAKTIWPGQDPIGQCLISGEQPAPPCARIVGIAADTHRDALREPPVMHYYIPFGQEVGFGGTVMLARVKPGASPAADIRHALVAADPTIRFVNIETIQERINPLTKPWQIGATIFSLSGLLALLVAAIGIYSVMSYLVADRTHEIGVRRALGARPSHVARLILYGSVGMAGIGVAMGVALALAASQLVEPLLFDVSARDPWIYAGVGVVLMVVALIAGIVPTIRANRIDPLVALRVD